MRASDCDLGRQINMPRSTIIGSSDRRCLESTTGMIVVKAKARWLREPTLWRISAQMRYHQSLRSRGLLYDNGMT
jgi:hypothetical protein